jgi:cell division protein FtsQ
MENKISIKNKIRKLLKISGIILSFSGVFLLLAFVNVEREKVLCWKLNIEIERKEGFFFVDEDDIREVVYSNGDSLLGKAIRDISTEKIRRAILQIPAVEEASVFKSADGTISVRAVQCTPLVRILNSDGTGFYITHEGNTVAQNTGFYARVPVVTGRIKERPDRSVHFLRENPAEASKSLTDDLYSLFMALSEDPFWKAQTDHVYVNDLNQFELIPRVGNHRILIGDGKNLSTNLKKMMAFYEKSLKTIDINTYSVIDLRFHNQVVCRKKT